MITVRIKPEIEQTLEALASEEGISKSALIRECLEEFIGRKEDEKSPWELGKKIFGMYGSGRGNLSTDRKNICQTERSLTPGHWWCFLIRMINIIIILLIL